jgi:hypothetical protein
VGGIEAALSRSVARSGPKHRNFGRRVAVEAAVVAVLAVDVQGLDARG